MTRRCELCHAIDSDATPVGAYCERVTDTQWRTACQCESLTACWQRWSRQHGARLAERVGVVSA